MKKKITISKLFLYKHRFAISYIVLGTIFIFLVFALPLFSMSGLSESEMTSAVTSHEINFNSVLQGDIVNLPYHALQKISIALLGLSAYTIKLPSIIIGCLMGFIIVSLLNHWFKRSIALVASILSILAVPFFCLSSSGTSVIMFAFWPTLLLWLGGKVQGKTNQKIQPRPVYAILLAFALVASVFTPYMVYLALFILIFVIISPHLRFTLKTLPKIPLVTIFLIVIGGLGLIGFYAIQNPATLQSLLFMEDFSIGKYFGNLGTAFQPFFTWTSSIEGVVLTPIVGLASLALAIIGLVSTAKGFLASRNALATFLIIFCVVLSGFNPDFAILLMLPLTILAAHGIRYLLNKWYGWFPTNPYARVVALVPIGILMVIIIASDLTHFVLGYRYSPPVASQFNDDLALVKQNLQPGDTLLVEGEQYDFYQILTESTQINVVNDAPVTYSGHLATLGKWDKPSSLGDLDRIITSPKSNNSDRIYLYIANTKEEE